MGSVFLVKAEGMGCLAAPALGMLPAFEHLELLNFCRGWGVGSLLTFTGEPNVSLQVGGAHIEYGHHLLTQRLPSVASLPPAPSPLPAPRSGVGRLCAVSAGRGGSWRIVNSTVVFPESHLERGGKEARI